MTSHFYSKLTQQQGKPFCYRDVARWLPSNGFDDYDLVLIPVHEQSHWTLAVINVQGKRLEYYDPLFGSAKSVLQNLRRLTLKHMRKSATRHAVEQWDEVAWSAGQGVPAQVL
jgi:sentrin-specific protease 1